MDRQRLTPSDWAYLAEADPVFLRSRVLSGDLIERCWFAEALGERIPEPSDAVVRVAKEVLLYDESPLVREVTAHALGEHVEVPGVEFTLKWALPWETDSDVIGAIKGALE